MNKAILYIAIISMLFSFEKVKSQESFVSILEKLSQDKDEYVRYGVIKNENTTADILYNMEKKGDIPTQELKKKLEDPLIGGELIEKMIQEHGIDGFVNKILVFGYTVEANIAYTSAKKHLGIYRNLEVDTIKPIDWLDKFSSPDLPEEFRFYVASNTETPSSILAKLSDDPNLYVRVLISLNPNVSSEILEKLSNDSDEQVRRCVASNANIPVSVLTKLSADESKYVRYDVANNPKTPIDILQKLAVDKSEYVRFNVARNPSTPAKILSNLANDSDYNIVSAIAWNSNTPLEVLKKLMVYKNAKMTFSEKIPYIVFTNPSLPESILKQVSIEKYGSSLAENPNLPDDILNKLAKSNKKSILNSIAKNPTIAPSVLEKLATSNDIEIQSSVAENPNTPMQTLIILSENENPRIRSSVAYNARKKEERVFRDYISVGGVSEIED